MSKQVRVETTITQEPFRCIVNGYLNGCLEYRRETDDPWAVMFTVDTVHQLIGASPSALTSK